MLRDVANRLFPSSEPGALVTVSIPRGAGNAEIGRILARAGVVSSATGFELRAQADGGAYLPGTYRIRRHERWSTLFDELTSGPPVRPTVKLTVPEGYDIRDIAARAARVHVSGADFTAALPW